MVISPVSAVCGPALIVFVLIVIIGGVGGSSKWVTLLAATLGATVAATAMLIIVGLIAPHA